MKSLEGKPHVGFTFSSTAPTVANTCSSCTDTPPGCTYTCAQQAAKG